MAKKVRIEYDSAAFRQILCSTECRDLVEEHAAKIAERAGGEDAGFDSESKMGSYGGGRWIAYAKTASYEAMKEEAENKTLSKAVT